MKKNIHSLLIIFIALFIFGCKKKDATPEPAPVNPTAGFPEVTTDAASAITETSAISGGNVTSQGSSTISAAGVCWHTSPSPTTLRPHTNEGAGTGGFSSNLTGLQMGTTYYVRAYATNSYGTAYGNEITFKTPSHWVISTPPNVYFSALYSGNSSLYGYGGGPLSRSSDGTTWTSIFGNLMMNVSKIIEHNSNIFVYGNGMMTGVYKAAVGTSSWSPVTTPWANPVNAFGSNGTDLYAAVYQDGLYKSADNGSTWTAIAGINFTNDGAIFFAGTTIFCGADNGVFKSTDNGATWSAAGTWPGSLGVRWFASSGSKIYLSTSNPSNAVYVSSDNGNSWTQFAVGSFYGSANYNGTLFSTDSGIKVLYSGASAWADMNSGLQPGAGAYYSTVAVFGTNLYTIESKPTGFGVYKYVLN